MNTFLNYIPGILPVVVGITAIVLHIKTSRYNFAIENRNFGKDINSKWSFQWFDFAMISLHLAFIAFMNMYFLAGHYDDIILSVLINGCTLFFINLQNFVFKIETGNDVRTRMRTIKI